MNIFAEMLHSLYDIKGYRRYLEQGALRTFLYGFLVDLIYIIASFLIPLGLVFMSLGGPKEAVNTLIPNFTLEDNRLWVEEPVEIATFGSYFHVDTDRPITEEITSSDLLAFDKAVVMDAEHIMIKNDGNIYTVSYADLEPGDWDRVNLLDEMAPYISRIVAAMLVFAVAGMELAFFLGAFLNAVIGSVIASMMRYPMTSGQLYKLSVHTRAMPLLLKLLCTYVALVSPVLLSLPFVVNFGISGFYMWKVIRNLREEEYSSDRPYAG